MKNRTIFFLIFLNCYLIDAKAVSYFISPSGSDHNTGISKKSAWRTIDKINATQFLIGDKIYFESNGVYEGSIKLNEVKKLTIGTYGKGKAKILSGNSYGLLVLNSSDILVVNLDFEGNGVENNNANGIEFLADKPNLNLANITIKNCAVSGFNKFGILINGDKSWDCGYRNVKILNCSTSENGESGIGSLAMYPSISHQKFLVKNCISFQNKGILNKIDNHSGNGIVLSGVNDCKIISCKAFENGADNRSQSGGPVGIWLWNCTNGKIVKCESHDNYTGMFTDGGGFDIDGGSSNCIIKKCNSYNNDGAGYLLCEFGSPLKFTNNTIKKNTSKNDGLKNGYGGITICGAGQEYSLKNCSVIKNKILVLAQNVQNNKPAAISFINSDFENLVFKGNTFEVQAGGSLINSNDYLNENEIVFKNNKFRFKIMEINCKNCQVTKPEYWEKLLKIL